MDEQLIMQILDLLHTMQGACSELYRCTEDGNKAQFQMLCGDMTAGLNSILRLLEAKETPGNKRLHPGCASVLDSLRRVQSLFDANIAACRKKIEFELLPLLQEAFLTYYFFQYLADHPEKLPDYYETEKTLLCANPYIDEAVRTGRYRYEVSFSVLAYNKLDYTKRCVESLLANIPKDLNYELILVNHGSTDRTKEYFEKLSPHKQLDIAVNGGGLGAVARIVEGEFTVQISNDVIVTPRAIENLLACIRSDSRIAWVVPATSNISNLQSIPAAYDSLHGLVSFAEENNRRDPLRWEERVRLCNPIDIRRNSVFYGSSRLCLNGHFHSMQAASFPDDRVSLLLRRSGYKLMLAKDAYCHHYGSVTLKSEIQQQNEQNYYLEGRKEFFRAFGVDPWGIGFCFDTAFMKRVVGDETGHVDVLGINCGLGSNSLKIKEQLKEYCHNTDVSLCNITSDERFIKDLSGIGDEAYVISDQDSAIQFLKKRTFSYIAWEDAFPPDVNAEKIYNACLESLCPAGRMFVKKQAAIVHLLTNQTGWDEIGDGWFSYCKAAGEPQKNGTEHFKDHTLSAKSKIIAEDIQNNLNVDLPWEEFQNSSILITGANGMIPSYVALTLLHFCKLNPQSHTNVFILVRDAKKSRRLFAPYLDEDFFHIIEADVSTPLPEGSRFDYIIHGASPADPRSFAIQPDNVFRSNVLGLYQLLELARASKARGVLFMSSGEIYGQFAEGAIGVISEDRYGSVDPLDLRSCYAESKRAAEMLCAVWAYQYGIPAKIVRISHTYGPTMDIQKDSRVFSEFVRCVIENQDIQMKSDGLAIRPFCYASDCAEGIIRVLLKGESGQAYNLASDEYYSVAELAELLCALFPERGLTVKRVERTPSDQYLQARESNALLVDNRKIKALGWDPRVSVREGFYRTIRAIEGGEL